MSAHIGGYASASPLEGSHAQYSSRLLLERDMTLLGRFTLLPGQVASNKDHEILGDDGASVAEVA
jgi:hypothetical protein